MTPKTTKIEKLRQKFASSQINLVDVMKYFDPTKNKLLTNLLTEEIVKKMQSGQGTNYELGEQRQSRLYFENEEERKAVTKNNRLSAALFAVVGDMLGDEAFYCAKQFHKYWVEGKLPNRDIHSYKSMDDIKNAVRIIDIKEFTKSDSIRIHKIFEDDAWLLVLPLSVKASQIYGAGTQWCTTNRERQYNYMEYTRNGLLVYLINKSASYKCAYHKVLNAENEPGVRQSQFYNAQDVFIDSMDLDIPAHILNILRDFIAGSEYKTNFDFPNYLKKEWEEFQKKENVGKELADEPAPQPVAEPPIHFTMLTDEPARANIAEIIEESMQGEVVM